MAGKGSGGVLGAVAKIVSLVLVAAMLGAVIWYAIATNGFSDFNRVKFGDTVLTQRTRDVSVTEGTRNVFTVTNLNFTTSAPTYKLEVYLNSEEPFTFTMNGDGESYSSLGIEEDIAEYFRPEITESGFTLFPPAASSRAETLLAWLYPDATETTLTSDAEEDADLFVLRILFSDNVTYEVYFHIVLLDVDISLDKDNIIFGGADGTVTKPEGGTGEGQGSEGSSDADGTVTEPEGGTGEGQGTEGSSDEEEEPQQKYSISYDYTRGGGGTGTSWSIVPSLTEAAAGEVTIRFIVSYGVSLGTVSMYLIDSEEEVEEWLYPEQVSETEYELTFGMPAENIELTVRFIME